MAGRIFLAAPSVFNAIYDDCSRFTLSPEIFFVFGSNLAGRHGKGAARDALRDYGAIYGKASGLQGRSYAIPTKDEHLVRLPLEQIKPYVTKFVEFSRQGNPCFLTAVGCGLAGYQPRDIAPMFKGCRNCWFPESWLPYIL